VRENRYGFTYGGDDGVAGGERDDVGAGDDAGALGLDERLDAVDEAEAAQRQVGRGVPLRLAAAAGGVEQHRRVAALRAAIACMVLWLALNDDERRRRKGKLNYPDEAVVEVRAEERGGDGGHVRDVLLHEALDDLLRARAAVRVEPVLQLRARAAHGDGHHHQRHQHRHCRSCSALDPRQGPVPPGSRLYIRSDRQQSAAAGPGR
jgi:hypothetical protein